MDPNIALREFLTTNDADRRLECATVLRFWLERGGFIPTDEEALRSFFLTMLPKG